MTEADLLRKEGQLISEKQYKNTVTGIILSLTISGIIGVSGAIISMVTNAPRTAIVGLIICVIGFFLMILSGVFAFKNATKIQLYRRYKANPQDFERKI